MATTRVIDRAARDAALVALVPFVTGRITNAEFEKRWPSPSADPAIEACRQRLWFFHDDIRIHYIDPMEPDAQEELGRIEAFLRSDLPYEWPRFLQINPLAWLLWLPPVGLLFWLRGRKLKRAGDFEVWPFIRRDDWPSRAQHAHGPAEASKE